MSLDARLLPSLPVRLPIAQTPKRALDPDDPDPCRGCSDCCEYIAVPISRPRSNRDYDELFWYLVHRNVWVFVDDEGDWFVQFNTPCRQLQNRRCGIYSRRPHVCRDYKVDECTTYGEGTGEKYLFRSTDELLAFLRSRRPKTYVRLAARYPDGFPSAVDAAGDRGRCDRANDPAAATA